MSPEQQQDTNAPAPDVLRRLDELRQTLRRVREEMGKIIVGQDDVVEKVLIAILVRGHCLLEGVPGLAKTLLVKTLSRITALDFKRIQFTPDLIPSDIVGATELKWDETGRPTGKITREGPVFANMLLADEINRASPKTQSALLEAMQEQQVTIGETSRKLPDPFFVLATQNPIEQEGTYPLPEAQLDRFLFKLDLDYPDEAEEIEIAHGAESRGQAEEKVQELLSGKQILEFQEFLRTVVVSARNITEHAVRLVRETRPDKTREAPAGADGRPADRWLLYGAGPRASIYLVTAAKAYAALNWEKGDRPIVAVDDVAAVAPAVLRHRVKVNYEALAERVTPDDVIAELLERHSKSVA